jgi:probable blue pigment (indigoidine) exporter
MDGTTGARRGDIALTALAPAAWGLTYIVTTELLPPGRPLFVGAMRAVPAGLILAAVARRRPHGSWWWRALVLGVLNIGAFFALLFEAAYRLPGGVASTLGSIQPVIAAVLGAVLLGERVRRRVLAAGAIGIAGVALLVLRAGAHLDAVGVAAGLAAACSMATGVVLTKRWGRPVPLIAFTSWQLLAGGLALVPLAIVREGVPAELTIRNLAGFAWLATGGTAVAYALWFRGIARIPVGQVSLLGILSPVVAVLAGWVVLHQHLTAWQLAGFALAVVGLRVGQSSGGRSDRQLVERGPELALPEVEEPPLVRANLDEGEAIEAGLHHPGDGVHVRSDVGTGRDGLLQVLGPDLGRGGVEVRRVGQLGLHLPAERRPPEVPVGRLEPSLRVAIEAHGQL